MALGFGSCDSSAAKRGRPGSREPEGDRMSGGVAVKTAVGDLMETDEAKALVESGRENGSLTAEEIALAFDELDIDAGQIDEFYAALEGMDIDIVGGGRDKDDLDLEPETREVSTDALQLFLKDVGRVDLLTAAQEVELAKRIE